MLSHMFLEASKDQTQLLLTLHSTQGQREEESKHRQYKPRPQCLLQRGAGGAKVVGLAN